MDRRIPQVRRRQLLIGGGLAGAAAVFSTGNTAAARADAATGGADGAPAAWSFPEHRTADQLAADGVLAGRQVEALASPDAAVRVGRILDRMRSRQDAAPGRFAVPFDRYRPAGAGSEVLVARGELVVRPTSAGDTLAAASRARATTTALAALGYTAVTERGSAPQTTLFRSLKAPADLARDIAALRTRGIVAAMNVVVPLGHIIKGDDHPAPTQRISPPSGAAVASFRIAVVDTGAAPARGDGWLDDVIVGPDDRDPLDVLAPAGRLDWGAGHGTFVAGVVRRVAPHCEIVAYRFSRGDGLGTDKDVAAALLRAAHEAHEAGIPTVINASLGTPAIDGTPPLAMQEAVRFIAVSYPDVLIVAAAGNLGTAERIYPAAFDGVVAVGALTHDLQPAPFSSHGPWVRCSATGVGVVSTYVRGVVPPEPEPGLPDRVFGADAFALWSGTSFAAPQVAGAIARYCQEHPNVTPRSALDALLAGRPLLPGYGRALKLLPGTPTVI
jgi:subtilisin family serine protease